MPDPSDFPFAQLNRLVVRYPRFTVYLLIGGSAAAIDLLAFLILFNWFGLRALVANVISVSIATLESFSLNALFNFRVRDRLVQRFLYFIAVSALGLVFGSALIYLLHDLLGFNGNLVKILVMPPVVVLQFLLNKHISFRS